MCMYTFIGVNTLKPPNPNPIEDSVNSPVGVVFFLLLRIGLLHAFMYPNHSSMLNALHSLLPLSNVLQ